MHTVIIDDCTGCKLCLPVCPTDCIDLVDPELQRNIGAISSPWPEFTRQQVERARVNTEQTIERNRQREQLRINRKRTIVRKQMQQEILAAIQRKQADTRSDGFNVTVNYGKNKGTK